MIISFLIEHYTMKTDIIRYYLLPNSKTAKKHKTVVFGVKTVNFLFYLIWFGLVSLFNGISTFMSY